MKLNHTGLVLEGGGLRGVYTSGVLRFFMDKGLHFPYVIGASMGACNAASYVSRQPERNRIVNIRFVNDSRYLSYRRLFTKGELFGMRFIFETVPQSLVPFDFTTFMENDRTCLTVTTDCITGNPLYHEKNELDNAEYMTILQASSSLPFIARPVHFRGRVLMDGGIADSVPVRKSLADGNTRNVLVLTRPKGYRKTRSRAAGLIRRRYPRYPGLCRAFETRYARYNDTMDFIDTREARRDIFVIRPAAALPIARAERNQKKLYAGYDAGYRDAAACYPKLSGYLK